MHKPESNQEKKTYEILWNFGMQTDHLIPAWQLVDIAVLADNTMKIKENEKRDKYYHLAKELKKV